MLGEKQRGDIDFSSPFSMFTGIFVLGSLVDWSVEPDFKYIVHLIIPFDRT